MSEGKELQKKLFNEKKNGWEDLSIETKSKIYDYCSSYMDFLNNGKTEREIIKESKIIAESNGFVDIKNVQYLKPGDKVYYVNREKSMYLAVIGYDNIENGINVVGAHADSPRLDLKPNPLYEDDGFAFFKTQYYGGIKKYQWTTIPLAMHGVIVKRNGEKIEVNIGEDDKDPVFVITDLLPHLAQEQMKRNLADGIQGEELNLLNNKYGITEVDFLSAELEIVPAFKARSLGFDASMVAAYGQDDKICVYTSLTALMNIQKPKTTAVCLISDKEEIGSMGNTGMESHVFDTFISELLNKLGVNRPNLLDKVFCNSKMLSADVDAGLDPTFASVSEKNNASYLGRGIGLNKYTGGRGKAGSSDANAEFVAYIRNLLESNNIAYQIAELGKVDVGGGGTIAYILANKGMDVIDCGVPVLSMHAPYEVTSKFDVYSAFNAYMAFYRS